MSDTKITFTRAGNAPIENLNSFILEAYADDKEIADVFCANFQWRVKIATMEGVVDIAGRIF